MNKENINILSKIEKCLYTNILINLKKYLHFSDSHNSES